MAAAMAASSQARPSTVVPLLLLALLLPAVGAQTMDDTGVVRALRSFALLLRSFVFVLLALAFVSRSVPPPTRVPLPWHDNAHRTLPPPPPPCPPPLNPSLPSPHRKKTQKVYEDPTFAFYDDNRAIEPRLEIREFDDDPSLWRQRSLLLLSWEHTAARPADLLYSYGSLARVHGLPFGAPLGITSSVWNGTIANATRWWAGGCHHADTLFPPWHRLYMLSHERAITAGALKLAKKAAGQPDAAAWLAAAQKLRLPRWDYTDPRTIGEGPSKLLVAPLVVVTDPATGANRTIRNPIYSFATPWRLNDPDECDLPGGCVGLSFQPEGRIVPIVPWAVGKRGYNVVPLSLPAGAPTLRWPKRGAGFGNSSSPNQYASNNLMLNKMLRLVTPSLILLTKTTLNLDNWWCFWVSPLFGRRPPGVSCPLSSLISYNEIHGMVHGVLGGINPLLKAAGHGTFPESSSYDPIFFLLHTQLDYVLSVYMELYPTQYVSPGRQFAGTYYERPGTLDTVDTPLPPWQKPNTTGFFTSADCKETEPFRYTYAPVQEARRRATAAASVAAGGGGTTKGGTSASARSAAMRAVLQEGLGNRTGAAGPGGYEYIATFERFPAGALRLEGLPTHQFYVFASVGAVDLSAALSGDAPADNLCGFAFNFDGMVAARLSATLPLTLVITQCVIAGGRAANYSSVARVAGDPASGPILVPEVIESGITYTVIGVDGLDYTSRVAIGKPTLRWALDLMAIGNASDTSGARRAGGGGSGSDADGASWDPVMLGVIE